MSDNSPSTPQPASHTPSDDGTPAPGPSGGGTAPDTDLSHGLSTREAQKRLEQQGENAITEEKESPLKKLLSFFWGPIPWMIEMAAILSGAVQHWADFGIILAMLLLNAGVGFWQEFKADNAIEALKEKLALSARVLRDGRWQDLPARNLVVGDVIYLKLGNIIPADVQLAEGDFLSVDQSALTGESLPVDMKVGDTAYSASIAKMGEMKAVVTATGMNTYFGKTTRLVEQAGTVSHFQRAVMRIGNFLIVCTIFLVVLIVGVALWRGNNWVETVLFAMILTVAAIPVALPAVLSVTMAVGAEKLAKLKAIVSRLVAIEELAGIGVLCSDKTGTLTQNKLTLGEPEVFEATDKADLMVAAALASRQEGADAIDQAILAGLPGESALAGFKVAEFRPFDPVSKRASATVEHDGARFEVAKGAPQVILDLAKPDDDLSGRVQGSVDQMASKGYRTLGVARREADGKSGGQAPWHFLGLLPLFDPPREDAAETIKAANAMGLEVKMVTGDHEAIARQIAGELGLGQNILPADKAFGKDARALDAAAIEAADGYARVFPEHKFAIVKALQAEHRIVGMTGDGVNDAPALKQADVGIAVSGATDAARAAADLVLTAPGLSVITTAIEEARRIFERMVSYATYRIAETVRVLLFMTLSILVFNFYPVTAVMIVLLALLNDFPIIMIAYDNAAVAPKPVRWDMKQTLIISTMLGLLGVIASFSLYWIAKVYLRLPDPQVQSLIFLKLAVAGHLTIFLTRNKGAIWQKPYPSWGLVNAALATKILATLWAVYGWFGLVTPIGWGYAGLVWGYAVLWFLINSVFKIYAYRLLNRRNRAGS